MVEKTLLRELGLAEDVNDSVIVQLLDIPDKRGRAISLIRYRKISSATAKADADAAQSGGAKGKTNPAPLGKYRPAQGRVVDTSTLYGKLIMGYQGWFSCADDGSSLNRWNHWTKNGKIPTSENIRVGMWPDLSEYEPDELYPTQLRRPDGAAAKLYSAWNLKTVMRHYRWMRDYNLDGAFHQRFINRIPTSPDYREFRNKVLDNVRQAAEANTRVWAVMYDVSDYPGVSLVDDIKNDWLYLVDQMGVTASPMYLRHKGKPLLVLRNLGMPSRPGTAREAAQLIRWFKIDAPKKYRVTLMGAVPGRWRTLGSDSKKEPEWASVYRSYDVLSPWTVGRYRDEPTANKWMETCILPDMEECARLGIDYMPVVWPGYSYHNANADKIFNDKPRMGGRFYWRQVHNVLTASSTMVYNAMFDEVDEGTAMFKVSTSGSDQPLLDDGRLFLSLDADGERLPSDWYLKLADYAGRALRKEIPLTEVRPIDP